MGSEAAANNGAGPEQGLTEGRGEQLGRVQAVGLAQMAFF